MLISRKGLTEAIEAKIVGKRVFSMSDLYLFVGFEGRIENGSPDVRYKEEI